MGKGKELKHGENVKLLKGMGKELKCGEMGNWNHVTKGKEKTKKFKVWKQRVLQRISVEKALGLGFMVELNLEEVGFMVKIGLEFILYLSTF